MAKDDFSGIKGFYLINKSNPEDLRYFDDSSISGIDFAPNVEKDGENYTIRIDSLINSNQDYELAAEDYAGNLSYKTLWLGESGIKIISPENGQKFDKNYVKVEFEIPEDISAQASDVFAMVDMDLSTVKRLKKTDSEFTFFGLSGGKHRLTIGTADQNGASLDMNSVVVEILQGEAEISFDADSLKNGQAVGYKNGIISGSISVKPDSLTIDKEEVDVDEDGHFEKEIILEEGRNIIAIGYEIEGNVKEYSMSVFADTIAPEIVFYSPKLNEYGGISVDGDEITVEGMIKDNSGFRLFVNGNMQLDRISSVPSYSEEKFRFRIPLMEGLNKLEFKAEDILGNVNTQILLVEANKSYDNNYPEEFRDYIKRPVLEISNPEHIFTVNFNMCIDKTSVNEQNIKIFDENLRILDTESVPVSEDSVEISSNETYEYGKNYYMIIENIKSIDGKILKMPIVQKFKIMP